MRREWQEERRRIDEQRNEFFRAWSLWEQDCLEEFNEKYGDSAFGGLRYTGFTPPEGMTEANLVEFTADGTAYVHGIGGVSYIRDAVTPWEDSPHFVK